MGLSDNNGFQRDMYCVDFLKIIKNGMNVVKFCDLISKVEKTFIKFFDIDIIILI